MENTAMCSRYALYLQLLVFTCGTSVNGVCVFDKFLVGEWVLFDSLHQLNGEYRIANDTIYPPSAVQQDGTVGEIKCVEKAGGIYLLVNKVQKSPDDFSSDNVDLEDEYFCSIFTRRSSNFIEWMHFYARPDRIGNYYVWSSCQVDVINQGGSPDISKYGRWTPLYAKHPTPVACPLNSLYHYAFTHSDPNNDSSATLDSCNLLNSELDAGCSEVDTFQFDYSKCKRRQANSDGGRFSCLASWSANFSFSNHLNGNKYELENKELQYVMLRNEDKHVPDTSVLKYYCYVLVHTWVTYGNDSDPNAKGERITKMSGVPIMCPPDIRPTGLFQNHFTDDMGEALMLKGKAGGNHKCQNSSPLSSSATMVTIIFAMFSTSIFTALVMVHL